MSGELDKIWEFQDQFFEKFFGKVPETLEERVLMTKEYAALLTSEVQEVLNCVPWKLHRRQDKPVNTEHVKEELTDVFILLVCLCRIWGMSPEQLIENHWRKAMVVLQRHSEEFIQNLEGKILLCDIDGVLCSYAEGLLHWMLHEYKGKFCFDTAFMMNCQKLLYQAEPASSYINAKALGLGENCFQEIVHEFRTTRGKVNLPVYPYAQKLLKGFKANGYKVILLTSRPIDKYPNLYTDTLQWLKKHDLPFDYLWWATDKGERIRTKGLSNKINFYIEDDFAYVSKMAPLCDQVIWINRLNVSATYPENVTHISGTAQMQDWVDTVIKGVSS